MTDFAGRRGHPFSFDAPATFTLAPGVCRVQVTHPNHDPVLREIRMPARRAEFEIELGQ